MSNLTNDEKLQNIKKRKVLKGLIIIFSVLTIVTSILSLWKNINPLYAIICFVIEIVLSKYREKLDPKEKSKKK